MYNLEYWKTHREALSSLSENERSEILQEVFADELREKEIGKYKFWALDNSQKLDIIRKWYPKAYEAIQTYYPCFAKAPNDYPPAVTMSVNRLLMGMCTRDSKALQFI